jgi:hypothetical protein
MKMQHETYANQKLSTEWGEMICDADGCVEVKPEAVKFFQGILKFKPVGRPAPLKSKPEEKAEEPEAEVEEQEEEKPSRFFKKGKK